MFRARHSIATAQVAPVLFLVSCAAMVLSAIPAIAQDIAYGPASYYVASTTGAGSGVPTVTGYSGAGLTIVPTFTANFVADFGANAAAAENAWMAAAQVYMNNFSDPIHINITVDAVTGTGVFGESNTGLNGYSYTTLRNAVVADATTTDDATAIGGGGSVTVANSGGAVWWVSRGEAKALKLIADDGNNDGTTTFGAGNPFSFSGVPPGGTYDFQGVAAHEIAEVMGRFGLKGGTVGSFTNSYSLVDDFSYTGGGAKFVAGGPNAWFSIDNGTTLLKEYNDWTSNGLDSRDWASGFGNDSFNQFSNSGVVNPVSDVDLREMDVIGYDRVAVPEPSTLALLGAGARTLCRPTETKGRPSGLIASFEQIETIGPDSFVGANRVSATPIRWPTQASGLNGATIPRRTTLGGLRKPLRHILRPVRQNDLRSGAVDRGKRF